MRSATGSDTVLKLRTSNEEFYRLYHQAIDDMAALRLPIEGTDHMVFVPAAGLPWFMAPFGRDSLIVSLQNILVYPEFARGALDVLGRWQAKERDDYRDAEPGKIMHELRYGELAHFKLIPHTPYYGTADATPLYLITLHAAWRATGDQRAAASGICRHAEAALHWIDEYGDRDGDGFQEYQTRSPVGYENMAWKDAGDSMVYADGTPVKGPKALCELQGYVYDAWLRMAEVFDALGRAGPRRRRCARRRRRCIAEFNEAFWDEASGFYAYMLDGEKRKVLTVASNPGHLLWSGIVPPERAARVVARLMAPDMNTGWGIRTLSSQHPAYNPYSYQNGSVWPHDNSLIALGFKRYGFTDEVGQIARGISRGGEPFPAEPVAGAVCRHRSATETAFPVQYLGANVPQAWAAGSAFALLQAMLGHPAGCAARRAVCRSGAAALAAGHDAVGSAAGQAAFRHPLLARRRGDEVRRAARGSRDGKKGRTDIEDAVTCRAASGVRRARNAPVMAVLDPAIFALAFGLRCGPLDRAWMAGPRPAMTGDG